ncbi:MAG: hypothetical protein QM731_10030 [Chitinophagaceae bacterium]
MTLFKQFLQKAPLFVITIPLFIVIHIQLEYGRLIIYHVVMRDIVMLFLPALIIFSVTLLLWRNIVKAGVLSALISLFYYFFPDLKDWLWQLAPHHFISSYAFLLPLCGLLLILSLVRLIKIKQPPVRTLAFINLLFLLFICYDLLALIYSGDRLKDLGDPQKKLSQNYKPCDTCLKPDIYYIIFDAYTSSNALQAYFNFNNEGLDSFLLNRRFYIVRNSTSNYNLTPFSVSGTFNLDYVNKLNTRKDFYMKEYLPGVQTVYKSELFPILRKEGYHIINNSIFDIDNSPTIIPYDKVWGINGLYQRHHLLHKIRSDIGWIFNKYLPSFNHNNTYQEEVELLNNHITTLLKNLDTAIYSQVAAPKFVYTHILLPHNPFIYDSTGNVFPTPSFTTDRNRYVQQVQYTNTIIRKITDKILDHASKPVVIILQGDHGFKFWDKDLKKVEFSNLNAFFFYNQDYSRLYSTQTNVNTFRIIGNTFFNQHFAILPDTSWFLQYR